MLGALWWGFVGGVALLIGAMLGLYVRTGRRVIPMVMALGAGVLMSAVAFGLTDEAYADGGAVAVIVGLALGAATFFTGDTVLARRAGQNRKRSSGQQAHGEREAGSGAALALGALLDGIPESAAIGVTLIGGGAVSVAMVAAVFLSNVPEAWSSAAGMRQDGRSRRYVLSLWATVTAVSALASLVGYSALGQAPPVWVGGVEAFAAGAIITMLADTMMPEAFEEGGPAIGLVTAAGFTLAFLLDRLG